MREGLAVGTVKHMETPEPQEPPELTAPDLPDIAWEALRSEHLPAATARQRRAAKELSGPWTLDLETGTAAIGGFHTRVNVIGNASDVAGTWMAGWAIVQANGLDTTLGHRSERAKEVGEELGVAQLADEQVLAEDADPAELAYIIAGLEDPVTVYRGPHPTGAVYFTLEDHRPTTPLDTREVVDTLVQVTAMGLYAPRVGIRRLLQEEGFILVESLEELTAQRDDDTLVLGFDDTGRLTGIQGELRRTDDDIDD